MMDWIVAAVVCNWALGLIGAGSCAAGGSTRAEARTGFAFLVGGIVSGIPLLAMHLWRKADFEISRKPASLPAARVHREGD